MQIGVEYDGGKFSRSGDKEQQTSRRSGTDVGNYRKQYARMEMVVGNANHSIIDSDERVVIL